MNSGNKIIVQKFGGTSVANIEAIKLAASKVISAIKDGYCPIVVVSAMAGVTNQLVSYCAGLSTLHTKESTAEYDAALSSGEIITSALMALALQQMGYKAQSMLGWQIPIHTDNSFSNALINDINANKLISLIDTGIIPVIAGFQGITSGARITTLGRGGSDTTAAAIAASANALSCDIYTDVEGVFSTDPRLVKNAKRLEQVSYEEMLEFASMGAKVLHSRCVQIAMRYNIELRVISTFSDKNIYTLVTNQKNVMENREITGITYNKNIASVHIHNGFDDFLIQDFAILDYHRSTEGGDFLINLENLSSVKNYLAAHNMVHKIESDIAIISIIGFGIKNDKNLIGRITKILQKHGIDMLSMHITEIKISFTLDESHTEKAVQYLHEELIG